MACTISVDFEKAPALKALEQYCGTNCTQFYSYLTTVIKNVNADGELEFKDDFIQNGWKGKQPLDIKTSDPIKVRDAIIKYFNKKYPSASDSYRTRRGFDKVTSFGYSNVGAREEAKTHFADYVYRYYNQLQNKGEREVITEFITKRVTALESAKEGATKKKIEKAVKKAIKEDYAYYRKVYCVEGAMNAMRGLLAKRLAIVTGVDAKTILANLTDNNMQYVDSLLEGSKDKVNLQLDNLIACYREFSSTDLYKVLNIEKPQNVETTDSRAEFIDEALWDSRLAVVRYEKSYTEQERVEIQAEQDKNTQDGETNSEDLVDDASFDTSIRVLNEKLGEYVSYMTHLGAPVRTLLGSLPQMINDDTNNGEFIPNTDNYLGIPNLMDPNLCATVLYHKGRFDNPSEMLKSIKEISQQVPGFGGFKVLHDILAKDINRQLEFYRVFSKVAIGKLEIIVENGQSVARISNTGINTHAVLKFQYMNNIKGTALGLDTATLTSNLGKIEIKINSYDETTDEDGSKIREIARQLHEVASTLYPGIDELTIRNFIIANTNAHNTVDRKANALKLKNNLDEAVKGCIETKNNYDKKIDKINLAYWNNFKIKRAEKKGQTPTGAVTDLAPLYAEGYISDKSESAATQLATLLLPYTLIDSPLNSRNVHGNQSSDIINSSMLTNLKCILESKLNQVEEVKDVNGDVTVQWKDNAPIVKFANHRFQQSSTTPPENKQYDFSNILVEHWDGDTRLNYGLFYYDEQQRKYVPTDYFDSLIQIRLFDGASNFDDGNNVSYSKMSKGDYLGTAWRAFFNTTNGINKVENSADYFMRIPSDAPKNFVITAPRYTGDGLLKIGNTAQINKEITEFINKVSAIKLASTDGVRLSKNPVYVTKHSRGLNLSSFVEHLQAIDGKTVNVRIPINKQNALKDDRENKVRIAFNYAPDRESKDNKTIYVMEGTYYDGVLHNASFAGFVEGSVNANIWGDIRRTFWTNRSKIVGTTSAIKWQVNAEHAIVKMMRNAFMQELTDMVTAANVMFETVVDKSMHDKGINARRIRVDSTGKPILKKDSTLIKSETDHNGLHPTYHFDDKRDDKALFIKDKDGNYKATGKVFTSDRFILFDYFAEEGEVPIKNFGEDILNEAFRLFHKRGVNSEKVLLFDEAGNVILTDAQKEAISKGIENFILKYIEHANYKLQNIESFIDINNDIESETDLGYATNAEKRVQKIAEFTLNTHLMYIAFNDLFEGDTKFYSNAQTFLKRAKEAQASGVPYGINDFTREIQPGHNPIPSPLSTQTFIARTIDENGAVSFTNHPITMYDTFKAITVYNTIKTDSNMLEHLRRHLTDKDKMGSSVMTDDDARTLLYGPDGKGGFTDTTVNDAQSYITFDEWVRRITARGQLPKYRALIDRILDETTPLDVSDIQEFVQVQKNFYYDQYYNKNTKVISPRQIKNAEFVLIPRLIRGTELEKVAEMMNVLGIDQLNTVETSKAGQSERFTLWDNDGHLSQDIIDDLSHPEDDYKSEIMLRGVEAAEEYNYNYLYTQQETPQHVDSRNKAGIQVMKKIIDNIDSSSPAELQRAKQLFQSLYADKIKRSFDKLMDRFKVARDENGNIQIENNQIKGIDYNEFYDALKEELARLGLDSNMVDYCTLSEYAITPSDTVMPNFMSLVSSKFENIVQSLFNNNITRQTLPGFHAAQVTGMGFRRFDEVVNKKMTSNILQYHPMLYVNSKGETITEREYDLLSDELKQTYTEDKIADYIEIMLPAAAFGLDKNAEAYAGLSEEDREKAMLKDLQKYKLDEIIGYRIPTEGKQSVCKMKVVGFTDDVYGSTIVVPDAWVSQTGADFDIDSIYGVQYNIRFDDMGRPHKISYQDTSSDAYNEFVKSHMTDKQKEQLKDVEGFNYDGWAIEHGLPSRELWSIENPEASISENSTEALENKMLDLMIEMLTHPASFEENLSRSNFDGIKSSLKKTRGAEGSYSERDARSPYNIFDQAEYQEDAMSGAALKAFSVVRDTFCSICNTLKPHLENAANIKVLYSLDYDERTLKARFGEDNVDKTPKGYIVTHTMFGWSNDNKNVEGSILTAYSSQTTAHILDAMKTGNVPNVNELTFQVYKTLVDIGSNYDTAISFITQPGIRRIIDEYNSTNSIYSSERGKNYIVKAVRGVLEDLNIEYDYKDDIDELLRKVNNVYGDEIEEIFGKGFSYTTIDEENAETYLDAATQFDRLHETGIFDKNISNDERPGKVSAETLKLLYDLQTIMQYDKIDHLAEDIRSASRVCNPDKFGAKQSIFATREVFNTMVDSIVDNATKDGTYFRLQVPIKEVIDGKEVTTNKHLLSAIYPGIENCEKGDDALNYIISSTDFINKSLYKPLAAFLKYATATSVKINKTLFVTQSDEFVDLITNTDTGLASVLSNGNRITEKTAKTFQNYIVNYIIMKSSFLQASLHYDMGAGGKRGFDYAKSAPKEYNTDEAERIFGYGHPASITVTKAELNAPNAYSGRVTPDENTIFVFGSNTEGRHGRGAAKVAVDQFGAIQGNASGLQGNAYALPTKNLQVTKDNGRKSLNRSAIIKNIKRLYKTAEEHPTKQFKVYHIPLNEEGLAGYTGEEMLEMFKAAGRIPSNVYFHEEWVKSGKLGQDVIVQRPFKVNDITAPTQEEVDDFNTMSPAQKITWIKQHYRDPGVLKYVTPTLFNERNTRDGRAGLQTLKFDDESVNIEEVRREFEDGFTSKDPFIASAVADIIKYAFFVEGYRMGMGNVSKMIKNSILLDGGRIRGTDIVREAKDRMSNISREMQFDITSEINPIIENYVRSHSNTVGINTHNVVETKDGFDLHRQSNKLIHLNGTTKRGTELAEKYGIAYTDRNGRLIPNKYTKLKFKDETILYRIKEVRFSDKNIAYFLIPLNQLELNENATFSANMSNNKYLEPEYYEILIHNYCESVAQLDSPENLRQPALKEEIKKLEDVEDTYRAKNVVEFDKTATTPIEDINSNPSFSDFVTKVRQWADDSIQNNKPVAFIRSIPMSRHIHQFGKNYSLLDKIKLYDGSSKVFRITKVNLSNFNGIDFVKKYTGDNIDKPIDVRDAQYEDLINIVQDLASLNSDNYVYPFYGEVYMVEPEDIELEDDDDLNFSTILDTAIQGAGSIYRRSITEADETAGNIVRTWKDFNLEVTKTSVNAHLDDVIIGVAKYLESFTNELENKLRHFTRDPETGNYIAVNDDKCIALVKKDAVLRKEYLKTLLDQQAVVEEFGLINELDIDSQDPHMQQYLKKIKDAISKIQNMPIVNDAYEKFAHEYLDKSTNNPLVRDGLISVLDGFYKTNWFNATFNDIQETSNPIIQIAMKNFQSDLRASQFHAKKQIDAFLKHMEDIKKRCREAGQEFNWDHIVDEAGRFVRNHTAKFIEDRDRLQQAYFTAIQESDRLEEEKGIDSDEFLNAKIKELKAKLEYDEWKAKYVELPVKQEYYDAKNKNLHIALYGYDTQELKDEVAIARAGVPYSQLRAELLNYNEPEIVDIEIRNLYENIADPKGVARYESLRKRRAKLRNKYLTDAENTELDSKIDEIDDKIAALRLHGSDTVTNYAKTNSALENKYFKYDAKYSFENVLSENLKIVQDYELSDMPYARYKDIKEYKDAKTWIKRNARFEPDAGIQEELNSAYEALKDPENTSKVRAIRRHKDYQNEYGEFDPTLVPDDQIDKLKEHQITEYKSNVNNTDGYNDRNLITNAGNEVIVYTDDFYNGISSSKDDSESKTEKLPWRKAVSEINTILSKYYDQREKIVKLELIPNNEEGIADLKRLRILYNSLKDIRGGKKTKEQKKFIEKNVDTDAYNESQYQSDKQFVEGLPRGQYKSNLQNLIYAIKDGKRGPNMYLYGVLKPKDSVKDNFIDIKKTEAIKTLNKYTERKLSTYWHEANLNAKKTMSPEDYQVWLDRNTCYNPYTGAVEPLSIWWTYEVNKGKGTYFPKYEQTNRSVRDGKFTHKEAIKMIEDESWKTYAEDDDPDHIYDILSEFDEENITPKAIEDAFFPSENFVNEKYNKNGGHSGNYRFGSNPEYDNKTQMNKFEAEAMHYVQDILMSLANTQDAKKYLERGWLPARHKGKPNNVRGWIEELAKVFGIAYETYNPDDYYDDVEYYKDRPPVMPMLEKVHGKGTKDVPKRPKQKPGQSEAKYKEELQKWEEKKKEIEAENLKIHSESLDRDFENVISDFIMRAASYNAVQENKYELFYAKQLIKTHGAYITAYNKRGKLRFKKNKRSSTAEDAEYLRQQDKYLIEQFDNQLRRILYNQFKEGNNPKVMKWLSCLQSLTSAQYMMLNVRGGIANVTLGESQIIGEAFAREFFDATTYGKGKLFYNSAIHDYILHSGDEKAGTLQGAIIKYMDIVDYDEHTGVSRLTKDAYEILRRVRDLGYTPQTAGEHGMQNSAMFTMMMSHRLVSQEDVSKLYGIEDRSKTFGRPKYVTMNFNEYSNKLHEKALLEILDDKQKEEYLNWKQAIVKDASEFKEFAWYQKDLTTTYIMSRKVTRDQQKAFVEVKKDLVKKAKKEFNDDTKHPTLLSQLTLGNDGKLAFKKDSMLAEIDIKKADDTATDAERLLADFKGRVISVNKYIHGVYDKSGRAQIEKTYLGSLLMQYHKHLPLGIMKRYRWRGMYSEERGTVVKGMYRSIVDFLAIPFNRDKQILGLTDEEADTARSLQNVVKNIVDFAFNLKLNYRMLPEYDKANLRRAFFGDITGMLAALFLTIAIKAGADDDDKEGLLYNLAIYETDRLATEAGQYIPFIAYTEAKKLWQSPIAAGSGITDVLSSVNLLCHMVLDGDDFDGEYHSGKFAGENKLSVYLQRRIPMWRGIKSSFIDINENNHFYKVGENCLGFFNADEKAEQVKSWFK